MSFNLFAKDLKEIIQQTDRMNLNDNDIVRLEYDQDENRYIIRRDINFNYVISLKGAGSESFGKTKFYYLYDSDLGGIFKEMLKKLNSSGDEYKITIYLCPQNLSNLHNNYRDKDYVIRIVRDKLEEYISTKLSKLCIIDVDYSGYIPIKELNNYR